MKRLFVSFFLLSLLGLLLACTPPALPSSTPEQPDTAGLANPASVYCENQGHRLEIRTDDQGNQYGVCIFEDGSECEEWAFFRGECGMNQKNKLAVNVVQAAGLQQTDRITILFLMDEPANRRQIEITDPDTIQGLVSALDETLTLVPPLRCPPVYEMDFHLKNGKVQAFKMGLCGFYGSQEFFQDLTVRPPEAFSEKVNAVLKEAGVQ